eukprot:8470493-Alexandrium_andersonii.AAC.1
MVRRIFGGGGSATGGPESSSAKETSLRFARQPSQHMGQATTKTAATAQSRRRHFRRAKDRLKLLWA